MPDSTHPIIPKRTLTPLFHLTSSFQGVYNLGEGVILKETDHFSVRQAMDTYLATLSTTGEDERFITYLSPHERDEFYAAGFCLEHEFEAPDYVGEAEKRSQAHIQKVMASIRVVKPTRAKPGLFLGWENRQGTWELRRFHKVGFDVYSAQDESTEDFDPQDIDFLMGIMPRVYEAYSTHGGTNFNRVANALNFFEMGYRTFVAEVRFVLFTAALESLFVTSKSQISKRFRERISRFLAQNPPDCQQLHDACQHIYDIRSAIIHGGAVAGGAAVIHGWMLQLQDIGRRCLRKILHDEVLFRRFQEPSSKLGHFLSRAS